MLTIRRPQVVLSFLSLLVPGVARAQCDAIADGSQRALCRARVQHDAGPCEAIGDNDLRNYCRAVATHQPASCEAVQANDLRQRCRAESGH